MPIILINNSRSSNVPKMVISESSTTPCLCKKSRIEYFTKTLFVTRRASRILRALSKKWIYRRRPYGQRVSRQIQILRLILNFCAADSWNFTARVWSLPTYVSSIERTWILERTVVSSASVQVSNRVAIVNLLLTRDTCITNISYRRIRGQRENR